MVKDRIPMTREEAASVVGSAVDDSVVLDIIGTGASLEELQEALAWLSADDAMTRSEHHQPHGLVAALCEILSRSEIEMDRD
jgi:hypothetical protein